MKTVCKKLLCLMLVAMLLVSAVPAAFAADTGKLVISVSGSSETYEQTDFPMSGSPNMIIAAAKTNSAWQSLVFDGATVATENKDGVLYATITLKQAEETDPAECTHPNKVLKAKESIAPTCEEDGNNKYYCGDCKHNVNEPVAKLGHDYQPHYTNPTCTTGAIDAEKCSRCGDTQVKYTWPANGHNYNGGKCIVCGEADPNAETDKEEKLVDITIYEVEVDANGNMLNAVEYKTVNNVNVNAYASTEAMAKAICDKSFTDFRYKDYGNGTAQLNVWTVETKDNKDVYQLKVMFNNGTTNYKMFDIYEGEGILAAIKNAGISPKYEDHVLVGYLKNHTGNVKTYLTIYDVASDANADADGIIKVYADWRVKSDDDDEDEFEYGEGGGLYGDDNDDPIYDVVLYIYTNGKTSSYAKKVTSSTMGRFTKDGLLTDDEVQLVVENYFKTNSNTKYYGLFDKETWNSGNYLTRNAEYEVKLDPNKTNYVYVMVKDATLYVADSSNPKTGDTIMIAVSGMALAAAGLVSMIELKKRKMI